MSVESNGGDITKPQNKPPNPDKAYECLIGYIVSYGEGGKKFFSHYGDVEEVSATTSKMGITPGDFALQVTLTRKGFSDIPNKHVQRKDNSSGGRRTVPYCWSCGVMGHMAKRCLDKKAASQFRKAAVPAAAAAMEGAAVPGVVPDVRWKEVGKKGRKTPSPPQQKVVPQQSPP